MRRVPQLLVIALTFVLLVALVISGLALAEGTDDSAAEDVSEQTEQLPDDTQGEPAAAGEQDESAAAEQDEPAAADEQDESAAGEQDDATASADTTEAAEPTEPVDPPAVTEATAAYLIDSYGTVLYDQNGTLELPMASITKLMTAMVALDSGIPLDEPVWFQQVEFPADSQVAGYVEGDTPTFGELLDATLVYSANDAAINLAYAVAGSREAFAELMNEKAAELGLEHTHFMNPHGLEEEGHYSCAADLCEMGRYAIAHYPFIRTAVKTRSISVVANGNAVTLESTDDLMDKYAGLRGIKTGNTQSGTSFLSCATNNHVTLFSCVLLCDTKEGRFADTRALLDWGFARYPTRELAHGSWLLRVAPWQDGFWASCPISARRDVTGRVSQDGELRYKTVQTKPATRVAPGANSGVTIWRDDGRYVGGVSYSSPTTPVRVPAWNPFVLPLFSDTEGMTAL